MLRRLRNAKKYDSLDDVVSSIKEHCSLREAARTLGKPWASFMRLCTPPPTPKGDRHVTDEHVAAVTSFVEKDNVTFHLPFKRQAKFQYMRTAIQQAYKLYVTEQEELGTRVLSFSSFYRSLPKTVRCMKQVPYRSCLCEDCLNFSLFTDAVRGAGLTGVSRRTSDVILHTLCRPSEPVTDVTIGDCSRECIFRECGNCGPEGLKSHLLQCNPNVNLDKRVVWHQWVKIINPETLYQEYKKECFRGTVTQLLKQFSRKSRMMSTHMFNFKWQGNQFELAKGVLKPGEVIMVMDFAQNYEHKMALEPQGAHWTHKATTLHPVVCYYLCPECNVLRKEELIMLSDDRNHDGWAVKAFEDTAVKYLRTNGVTVTKVIQFTDNCASQYKSRVPFEILSNRDYAIERNYFGAKHGKGPGDAAIGRVKRQVADHQRTEQSNIVDTLSMFEYCDRHLSVTKFDNDCVHPSLTFFLVNNIQRTDDTIARTLYGTQQYHSVRNTGVPGFIEVRANSCFCTGCLGGGDCEESRLVKPFTRKNIFGRDQLHTAKFENVLHLDVRH
jgi:hypothetical protein